MKRSIFTRYMIAFVLVLLATFLAVAAVMCFNLASNERAKRESDLRSAAKALCIALLDSAGRRDESFSETVSRMENDWQFTTRSAKTLGVTAYITDADGRILFTTDKNADDPGPDAFPRAAFAALMDNADKPYYTSADGFFDKEDLIFTMPVYLFNYREMAEKKVGAVIVRNTADETGRVIAGFLVPTLAASVWVFIISIVALYFIVSRLNRPIRDFREAVNKLADGDYTARVKLSGVSNLDELAVAFNDMAEAIEHSENSRRIFISNVSHDLRTPMTKIKGFVDAILDGTIKPDKQDYYLNVVSTEINRLSRLVGSLLDISRMESGKLRLNKEVFDVCETVRLIVISFEKRIEEKKIVFDLQTATDRAYVYADKDAIYQVLYNLLENAVKFTDDGGEIRVIVKKQPAHGGDGKYVISVYNTGEGIPEEERTKVFERFFKADPSRGLDPSGVGLGLFIVKSKLDMHGERISVVSDYGKNCTFTFSLPAGEDPKRRRLTERKMPEEPEDV